MQRAFAVKAHYKNDDCIEGSPRRSARCHAVLLNFSDRSLRRILYKDLNLQPRKIPIVHALKDRDHVSRTHFSCQLLVLLDDNENLIHNLFMIDLQLSGFVNKQNFRYWSDENPHQVHEKPLHSAKVAVWYAISSFGIIGSYFFEDNN